jgi:DNA-binding NtrC family response regulator
MNPLLILVVDGDPERRQRLLTWLRGPDREVMAASDPEAAAEALTSRRVDTLVLDLSLPWVPTADLRRALAEARNEPSFSLEDAERAHLARVLQHTDGNKRRAAHLLGISRSTLLNKVRKYGLQG